MSDIDAPLPADGNGPVESKTWAATFATFIASFAGLTLLSSVDTDMINGLPDWLETPVYSLLTSGIAYLSAYYTAHKPGKLSFSALRAARQTR